MNEVVSKNLEQDGYKPSEKVIKKFEKKIKESLPKDYRDFLSQTNGGELTNTLVYPFTENGRATHEGITVFYGLSEDGDGSLDENFEIFRDKKEPRMLNYMIPIGEDEGGNQIVILLNKKEFGHVYFWDHEFDLSSLEKGDDERENCHLIAKSFTEFLNLLRESET